MPAFDFQGALDSGMSQDQITQFLASKGQDNLATDFFSGAPSGYQAPKAEDQGLFGSISHSLGEGARGLGETMSRAWQGSQSIPETLWQAGTTIGGTAANVVGDVAVAGLGAANDAVNSLSFGALKPVEKAVGKAVGGVAMDAANTIPLANGQTMMQNIKGLTDTYNQLDPVTKANVKGLWDATNAVLTFATAGEGGALAKPAVEAGMKGATELAGQGINAVRGVADTAMQGAKEALGTIPSVANGISKGVLGKGLQYGKNATKTIMDLGAEKAMVARLPAEEAALHYGSIPKEAISTLKAANPEEASIIYDMVKATDEKLGLGLTATGEEARSLRPSDAMGDIAVQKYDGLRAEMKDIGQQIGDTKSDWGTKWVDANKPLANAEPLMTQLEDDISRAGLELSDKGKLVEKEGFKANKDVQAVLQHVYDVIGDTGKVRASQLESLRANVLAEGATSSTSKMADIGEAMATKWYDNVRTAISAVDTNYAKLATRYSALHDIIAPVARKLGWVGKVDDASFAPAKLAELMTRMEGGVPSEMKAIIKPLFDAANIRGIGGHIDPGKLVNAMLDLEKLTGTAGGASFTGRIDQAAEGVMKKSLGPFGEVAGLVKEFGTPGAKDKVQLIKEYLESKLGIKKTKVKEPKLPPPDGGAGGVGGAPKELPKPTAESGKTFEQWKKEGEANNAKLKDQKYSAGTYEVKMADGTTETKKLSSDEAKGIIDHMGANGEDGKYAGLKLLEKDASKPLRTDLPTTPPKETSLLGKKRDFAKDLTPEGKALETKAFHRIDESASELIAKNAEKHGTTVNADDFRPLFKDIGYNGSNAAAVQEPASELAKLARAEFLKNPEPYALSTMGGSGAGKTSALSQFADYTALEKEAAVTLDSNLSNYESTKKWLDQVAEAGKKSPIYYVYREPMDALENGVVKRSLTNVDEMGRIVPTEVVSKNHIGSWDVAQRLFDEGYDVRFIDNSLGFKKAKVVSIDDLRAKIKYPDAQTLKAQMDARLKELLNLPESNPMKITQAQYDGYVATSAKEVPKVAGVAKSVLSDADVTSIVNAAKEGGFTFDTNARKSLAGTPHIAVSPYPERSFISKSGELPEDALHKFYNDNKDLLVKDGHTMGGWVDSSTGQVYIDVAVAVPKENLAGATRLGKLANQKAIFDLQDFKEIPTGGTGEPMVHKSLGSVEERANLIQDILKGKKKPLPKAEATTTGAVEGSVGKLYRGEGKNTGRSVYGEGQYVTDNPELAKRYGKVSEVSHDIKKPFDASGNISPKQLAEIQKNIKDPKMREAIGIGSGNKVFTYQSMQAGASEVLADGKYSLPYASKAKEVLNEAIKKAGYDSIKYNASGSLPISATDEELKAMKGNAYVIFKK